MSDRTMGQPWLDLCTAMSVDQREQRRDERREKLTVSLASDEVGLIELVATGDVRAYRQLVDRHLRGIHAFAYRMLGSRAEAEEVAQETFLRLWQHAGRYVPQAKPSTWRASSRSCWASSATSSRRSIPRTSPTPRSWRRRPTSRAPTRAPTRRAACGRSSRAQARCA